MKHISPGHLIFRKSSDSRASSSGWSRHPIFLALFGFLLTGVLGSCLTNQWQELRWRKEQRYQVWLQSVTERRSLSERVLTSVAGNVAAANNVISLYDWEFRGPFATDEQVGKRISAWIDRTAQWHVDQEVLGQQLAAIYTDERVRTVFDGIRADSVDLTVHIANLLAQADKRAITEDNQDAVAAYKAAVLTSKRITATLRKLSILMSAEINDVRNREPGV